MPPVSSSQFPVFGTPVISGRPPAATRLETGSWQLAAYSKLHHRLSAFDQVERHAVRAAPFLEQHLAGLESGNPSRKRRLPVQRLDGDQLGKPAAEPPIVRLVTQR